MAENSELPVETAEKILLVVGLFSVFAEKRLLDVDLSVAFEEKRLFVVNLLSSVFVEKRLLSVGLSTAFEEKRTLAVDLLSSVFALRFVEKRPPVSVFPAKRLFVVAAGFSSVFSGDLDKLGEIFL